MFTGIIEEIGTVKSVRTGADTCILTVSAKKFFQMFISATASP